MTEQKWAAMNPAMKLAAKATHGRVMVHVIEALVDSFPIKINKSFKDESRRFDLVFLDGFGATSIHAALELLRDEGLVRFVKKADSDDYQGLVLTPVGHAFISRIGMLFNEPNFLKIAADPSASNESVVAGYNYFMAQIGDESKSR